MLCPLGQPSVAAVKGCRNILESFYLLSHRSTTRATATNRDEQESARRRSFTARRGTLHSAAHRLASPALPPRLNCSVLAAPNTLQQLHILER